MNERSGPSTTGTTFFYSVRVAPPLRLGAVVSSSYSPRDRCVAACVVSARGSVRVGEFEFVLLSTAALEMGEWDQRSYDKTTAFLEDIRNGSIARAYTQNYVS